jgi:hypothetical protein
MEISALKPAKALFDPVDGVGALVEGRKWVWPLLFLVVAVSLSGAAFAKRWDATPQVTSELEADGELAKSSEREVADKVQTAERVKLVGGVAKGVFLMPLLVLALAVLLKIAGWLFGTSAPFAQCFTVAAVGMLPIALFHLIFAFVAFRQLGVTQAQLPTLVPSNLLALRPDAAPKLARALGAIDFFNLWSVVMLGLGFSAASGMRRGRALLLCSALYLMYAGVVLVAVPGMGGGR